MRALTRAHAVAIYYKEYPKWEREKRIKLK
jgi:hypothetical protein